MAKYRVYATFGHVVYLDVDASNEMEAEDIADDVKSEDWTRDTTHNDNELDLLYGNTDLMEED